MRQKNLWLRIYSYHDIGDTLMNNKNGHLHSKLIAMNQKWFNYPIEYSYNVLINEVNDNQRYKKVSDWCNQNFSGRFCLWAAEIRCQYETDAMAFKLRWI